MLKYLIAPTNEWCTLAHSHFQNTLTGSLARYPTTSDTNVMNRSHEDTARYQVLLLFLPVRSYKRVLMQLENKLPQPHYIKFKNAKLLVQMLLWNEATCHEHSKKNKATWNKKQHCGQRLSFPRLDIQLSLVQLYTHFWASCLKSCGIWVYYHIIPVQYIIESDNHLSMVVNS